MNFIIKLNHIKSFDYFYETPFNLTLNPKCTLPINSMNTSMNSKIFQIKLNINICHILNIKSLSGWIPIHVVSTLCHHTGVTAILFGKEGIIDSDTDSLVIIAKKYLFHNKNGCFVLGTWLCRATGTDSQFNRSQFHLKDTRALLLYRLARNIICLDLSAMSPIFTLIAGILVPLGSPCRTLTFERCCSLLTYTSYLEASL